MKTTLLSYILFLSTMLNAQSFDGKKYVYKKTGIAFQINKSWVVDTFAKPTLNAFNKEKNEIISLSIAQEPYMGDYYKDWDERQMANFKEQTVNTFKKNGIIVNSVEVTKGKFLNYYALFVISHVGAEASRFYEKRILFTIKGRYLASFQYDLPEKYLSKKEINYLESRVFTVNK